MKPSLGMSHTESGSSEFALRRSPRLLGKFGLRRSPRLLGKSAMSMPKRSQIAPRRRPAKGKSAMTMLEHSQISPRKSPDKGKSAMNMPESPRKSLAKDSDVTDHELTLSSSPSSSDMETEAPGILTEMRLDRERSAQSFREDYTYRFDLHEKKTCIHPGGELSWEGKDSSGFTYVAVRAMYSTCVVFKRTLEHVEDRLSPYLQYNLPELTFHLFGLTAISDIEVLANLTGRSRHGVVCGERIDQPFAIVSVDPSNDIKDPVKDEDQLAVLEYFKGILRKGKDLYPSETEEAAIHAFQLLYHKKFKPEDIWVAVAALADYRVLPKTYLRYRLSKINSKEAARVVHPI